MHTSNALRTWIVHVGFSPISAAYSSFGMACVHVLSAREDALNLILRQGIVKKLQSFNVTYQFVSIVSSPRFV